jgi:hypothetical protein
MCVDRTLSHWNVLKKNLFALKTDRMRVVVE